MAVKTSVTAKFNYTGRKKIPLGSETVSIEVSDRRPEALTIAVDTKPEAILERARISKERPVRLVVDAFYRGNIHRIEIPKHAMRQKETIPDCTDQVNPTFRLMVISDDNDHRGKILAATTFFGATENTGNGQSGSKDNAFFNIERSDSLEGAAWSVDWNDINNPRINLNGRIIDKGYTDQNKEMRAFIFPSIIREIMCGLLFRVEDLNDLPEGSGMIKWKMFFEQRLGVDFVDVPENDPQSSLNFIDDVVKAFSQQKWGHGKTLLDELTGE